MTDKEYGKLVQDMAPKSPIIKAQRLQRQGDILGTCKQRGSARTSRERRKG